MGLSPKEIKNRKFHQSLTGYDAKEVSLFLKDIALEMEKISMRNIHLSEANKTLDKRLASLRVKMSLIPASKRAGHDGGNGSEDKQSVYLAETRLKADDIVRQVDPDAADQLAARAITLKARHEAAEILSAAREEAGKLAAERSREAKTAAEDESLRLLREAKATAAEILREARERQESLEEDTKKEALKQSKEFAKIVTSQAKKEAEEILAKAREEARRIVEDAMQKVEGLREKLVDETRKTAVGRSKKFISEAERQADEILSLAREEAE